MKVGMLWLDDDKKRTFEEKVALAADYYHAKYGNVPDLCLVNKGMVDGERKVGAIRVQPVRNVLPNHFWVGINSG